MSQHIVQTDEATYVYGFDYPLSEYFMYVETAEDVIPLVGMLASNGGTRGDMLEALAEHGITDLLPNEHINALALDLPF
jgi:hypothetical protein